MDFQKIHENAEGEGDGGRGGRFYLITVSIRYSFTGPGVY